MELLDKLNILADAAKYDAACTSSGLDRAGRPGTIGSTTMAGCNPFGVAPNQGVTPNYCTPMESQFMAEVSYATTQIDRATAGMLVEKLVQKYEAALESKQYPRGKTFAELYDLETVEPKEEYVRLHDEIWTELEELGLPQYRPSLDSYR